MVFFFFVLIETQTQNEVITDNNSENGRIRYFLSYDIISVYDMYENSLWLNRFWAESLKLHFEENL